MKKKENLSKLRPEAQTKRGDDSPPLPSYNVDDETKLRQLLELLNSPLVPLISPPDISEGDDSSWILPGVHPS